MSIFTGTWFSSFGPLTLTQQGKRVAGTYRMGQAECAVEGAIKDGKFVFRYQEPRAAGEGWFELERPGKFTGRWRQDGTADWGLWEGTRGFEGIWQSSFGPMRLWQVDDRVTGCYECTGHATIDGRVKGDRLTFNYQEPKVGGEGWFELAADGGSFAGKWRTAGATRWSDWRGQRVLPVAGVTWLVVLEAHWQAQLNENEYAFGHMLREFFARVPGVRVRQRFFTNAQGLQKWCQEIMYLAEPAVLVIASHGTPEGLTAHGEIIDGTALAEGLRDVRNLRLLHFSSCLMMAQGAKSKWYKVLQPSFPVSGYTTSVDWAASAMTEFLFLDMILSKGFAPAAAAEQITRLLPFAGDAEVAGSPYPPAGFRLLPGIKGA